MNEGYLQKSFCLGTWLDRVISYEIEKAGKEIKNLTLDLPVLLYIKKRGQEVVGNFHCVKLLKAMTR